MFCHFDFSWKPVLYINYIALAIELIPYWAEELVPTAYAYAHANSSIHGIRP